MELVKEIANKGPESQGNIAIRVDEKSYTYLQLLSSARSISNLLSNLDLKNADGGQRNVDLDGARVGIITKPCAEFVAGILGTWLSGGVAVPLARSHPLTELLHMMSDSDISVILSMEDPQEFPYQKKVHQELLNTLAAKTGACVSLIPPISNFHVSTKSDHAKEAVLTVSDGPRNLLETRNRGEDPAFILYTSGTTGKPKGVVHTHKGILTQVQILSEAWEYTSTDQFLQCLPLHHAHGLFNALLAPLYAGSIVDFIPEFNVEEIWQRWCESYPADGTKSNSAITVFTGVPTMYTRLIQGYEEMDPELQAASASAARHLRLMMCSSSALPFPVMQQWETITGHQLLESYGITEFVMAISNPVRGKRKGGTVGKPFPSLQAKILLDDESGTDKSGIGELCIKSPSLFKEYWKLPEVTNQSFTHDEFFKTGDAVIVDEDGYYIILGRIHADIIKVSGYKFSALEIEAVLLEHPAISECCVLGLPDKDFGEVVCAIIVPYSVKGQRFVVPSLHELSDWAKERLDPYKIPRRLLVWYSLPCNAMGKVNKKELKEGLAYDLK